MGPLIKPNDEVATNAVGFSDLMRSIENGKCIGVIGAGLSAPDFPPWSGLLAKLLVACSLRAEDLPSEAVDDLKIQADFLRDHDRAAFYGALKDVFLTKSEAGRATRERYHLLARIKFCSFINLNFDSLLCDACNLRDNISVSTYPHLSPRFLEKGEIYHVHGRIHADCPDDEGQIVLTQRDFDEAYEADSMLRALWNAAFSDYDVCFLGCNPAEPSLSRIIEVCQKRQIQVHGLTDSRRPYRFLVWDDGTQPPDLTKAGIHVVHYPRKDESFTGLLPVLRVLSGDRPISYRLPGVDRNLYSEESQGP